MKLSELAFRRPVFTAKSFVAISILDLVALKLLPIDPLPKMEIPTMAPITSYPGASAEDVEAKLTNPSDQEEILERLQAGEQVGVVGQQTRQHGSRMNVEVGE